MTPLQRAHVQQRSNVRLPGLNSIRGWRISYRRRVVLVRQRCEVVTKLVNKNVIGKSIVGSDGAIEIEDSTAAVSPIVHEHFNEFVRRKLRRLAQRVIVEGQHIAFRSE